jgi:hypothetical protein
VVLIIEVYEGWSEIKRLKQLGGSSFTAKI